MEVPLATLLVATASLLVVRDRPLAAATLGLATLARPEAGLLIILHVASARDAWTAVRRGAVAALVVAPAVAFNLATVGRVVPATAAAKVRAGLVGVYEGTGFSGDDFLYRLAGFALQWVALLFSDHLALPVLALAGLVILRRTPLGCLGWALALHPVATAVVAPYGGPAFQTGRYSSHLLPLAVTAGAVGLGALFARLPSPLLRSAALRRWRSRSQRVCGRRAGPTPGTCRVSLPSRFGSGSGWRATRRAMRASGPTTLARSVTSATDRSSTSWGS